MLSIAPGDIPLGLPDAQTTGNQALAESLLNPRVTLQRVVYETPDQPWGDDFTSLAPASGQAIEIDADFQLHRPDTGMRLRVLVLLEGKSVPEASGV